MTGGAAAPKVSVLLITLNEERLLAAVLESVAWADEIVIVDSGSVDRTEEIARRYTDNFHHRAYDGEGAQRQHSLDLATGDWVFYVDGDEIVTPTLAASVQRVVAEPGPFVGFRVQLHTFFLGRWFGTRGWRREWKPRLFRRDRGAFRPVPIHSGALIAGRVGKLEGELLHYPFRDLAHVAEKINSYSTRMVEGQEVRRSPLSGAGAVGRGTSRFLRDYLLGGDFLYGSAGLIRSSMSGYSTFLKYAKQWERERAGGAAMHRSDTTRRS